MRNNSENKTSEIKELEPGILFYGSASKGNTYGFGLLLGPNQKSHNIGKLDVSVLLMVLSPVQHRILWRDR